MAYDAYLEERISAVLDHKKVQYRTMKMMGGLCYMVDDKMCIGIMSKKDGQQSQLMARIGPDVWEASLQKDGCSEMNFTGRSMKGYVFLDEDVVDIEEDLEYWIQLCLDFNPLAKLSPKKKKKPKK